MDAAASGYSSLKDFVARASQIGGDQQPWVGEFRERFAAAISDDLNMPMAMAAVSDMIREADRRREYGILDALYDFDRVLGLKLRESAEAATSVDSEVEALIRGARAGQGRKELGAGG